MGWRVGSEEVAEIQSATIEPGGRVAGAYEVQLRLAILIKKAAAEQSWSIALRGAELSLDSGLSVGFFRPREARDIYPMGHATTSYDFVAELSGRALQAIEQQRDGKDLRFKVVVAGHIFAEGRRTNQTIWDNFGFGVPRSVWIDLLGNLRFSETILIELPIVRGVDRLPEAAHHLDAAIADQQRGDHADAICNCRKALDALGTIGFDAHAPSDVVAWIKQNARQLTIEERVAAVKVVFGLYFSPACHGENLRGEFKRPDADFAIAATAALLKIAPQRLQGGGIDGGEQGAASKRGATLAEGPAKP